MLALTTEGFFAEGGPRRRSFESQLKRLRKSLNVDGFNLDASGRHSGGPLRREERNLANTLRRDERNLANVFPFVGGERGQIRDLDPVLHNSRHGDHADHVAHHLDHNDDHQGHGAEHHDPHHGGTHEQHHADNHHDQHHHPEHHDQHPHHEEPSFVPIPNAFIDSRGARQRGPPRPDEDDVALDIGSIAAAGERCIDKVVMVQETEYDDVVTCKHSYSEKCHTTYTTDFEPQQEEVCEENYIKNCFIEYKKVAGQETVEFCHTPLVCEGEGPVECKTVYESQCQTRYLEHDVEEDKVACDVIQGEKCEDVTQGYTTEQRCTKWPVQQCQSSKENVKKYSPETDCKKVPRQLCGPSGCQQTAGPEECFDRQETVIQEVSRYTYQYISKSEILLNI